MTGSFRNIIFYLSLSGMLFISSCGEEQRRKNIRELEKQFRTTDAPAKKSELANILHKEYSLYHLDHENDTSFLLKWADMAIAGKEFKQARWIYDQYISIQKSNPDVFEQRGRLNALSGYFAQAGEDFQTAASLIDNQNAKNRLREFALTYKHSDSVINAAEEKLREGIDIEKNTLKRANELIKMKQLAAARYDIEYVLETNRKNASAYYLMAKLQYEAGDLKKASEMIDNYNKLETSGDIFLSAATRLEKLIQEKTELAAIQNRLQNNAMSYEDLVEAGTISFRLKKYNNANEYFNKLISQYPDSTLGYLYRGQVNLQTGKLDKAMNDIKIVLSKKPGNISAHNLKAYIHLLRKEFNKLEQEVEFIRSKDGAPLEILEKTLEENK